MVILEKSNDDNLLGSIMDSVIAEEGYPASAILKRSSRKLLIDTESCPSLCVLELNTLIPGGGGGGGGLLPYLALIGCSCKQTSRLNEGPRKS